MDFKAWPKIDRWNKSASVVITEKLDGTNACVVIGEAGEVEAQSRTRMITPENDNFGFARWVEGNKSDLLKLGPGYHFGEWWGLGIQRGYGLTEKRFSLFNAGRWSNSQPTDEFSKPDCCHVVPVIEVAHLNLFDANARIEQLIRNGSHAAPGFMKPEGLVFWIPATGHHFKKLVENDSIHKGELPSGQGVSK